MNAIELNALNHDKEIINFTTIIRCGREIFEIISRKEPYCEF